MTGVYTLTIELTPRERADVVQTLQRLADEENEDDQPAEADRLRGLASPIERE